MSLRLLVITDAFGANSERGSDVFCTGLARTLRNRHEVTIVAPGEPEPATDEGNRVIQLAVSVVADATALEQALSARVAVENFDLIYNLGGLAFGNTVVFSLLAVHGRLPLVNHFQTLLGSYAGEEGYGLATVDLNQQGQKEIAKHAVLNIFLSQSEYRDALVAGFELSHGISSVIPAGVRAADVKGVVPRSWLPELRRGSRRPPTVFLAAGRFGDYIKGADLVFRAFTYLYRQNPDVFLVVVSNSRRFADLLQGLPEDAYKIVDWLPRNEFLETVAGADVVIVPSRYESFGLIAVEAMTLGKPVVGNNVGGIQEIVHHMRTGVLNDVREGSFGLYRALQLLAGNRRLAKEMGSAARARAAREYEIERVCDLVDKSLAAAMVRTGSLAARVGL